MRRMWAATTAVCAAACVLVATAAAQTDDGGDVEIVLPAGGQAQAGPGVRIIRGSALSDVSAGVRPRMLRIAPAAAEAPARNDAKRSGGGASLLGAADAEAEPEAEAEDTPAPLLAEEMEEAAAVAGEMETTPAARVALPAAVAATQARAQHTRSTARSDDINGIVLSALACSSAAPTMCGASEAGLPGAALTTQGSDGTLDQQRVASLFRDMMAPVWTAQQQRAIEMIGYYSAAAALCEQAELDPEQVARLVQANFTLAPGATVEQIRYRHDALSMHIGMATGLALGAHMESAPRFCDEARGNRHNFATSLLMEVEGPDLTDPAPDADPGPAPLASR